MFLNLLRRFRILKPLKPYAFDEKNKPLAVYRVPKGSLAGVKLLMAVTERLQGVYFRASFVDIVKDSPTYDVTGRLQLLPKLYTSSDLKWCDKHYAKFYFDHVDHLAYIKIVPTETDMTVERNIKVKS